ncbi:potassium-transporting ATPase subunit F [[Phormidium ambiguum] IAM M-71]|uniref:Potassium-transporting ATPase subunit F n=1 Tax=[Phormidium ambiguum] IAM M-71 TaxID=454136 RepID=A0A1U7ITW4_9CYAN|nr:K(+)-transporting ATPase subunit F [Phormidium ambiguum]OKH40960.1 potassium-transporting ATPase subunit F [Phormidium ambiguum IAM M-71]
MINFRHFWRLAKIQLRKKTWSSLILSLICLNLIVAPAVYAAAGGEIERSSAWAIGLLGLLTLALSIYLFVVIFQPERF